MLRLAQTFARAHITLGELRFQFRHSLLCRNGMLLRFGDVF